jgi:hypothetical protein
MFYGRIPHDVIDRAWDIHESDWEEDATHQLKSDDSYKEYVPDASIHDILDLMESGSGLHFSFLSEFYQMHISRRRNAMVEM